MRRQLWLAVMSAVWTRFIFSRVNAAFDEFAPHVFRCPYLLPYPSPDLYWCGGMNDLEATCVHRRQMCDGYWDCRNGRDEEEEVCREVPCPEGYAHCANKLQCVPFSAFCDGKNGRPGCYDRSDELPELCKDVPCDKGMVKCADNIQCIGEQWVCDGAPNCNDKSDELNCEERSCGPEQSKCGDGVQCVDVAGFCDGEPDQCKDGSDEDIDVCRNISCPDGMEKCADGFQCYSARDRCDGVSQCKDRSDELGCASRSCGPGMVKCRDGEQCVWARALCEWDRWYDCDDASDEDRDYCRQMKCPKDYMKCNGKTQCVHHDQFCDGKRDCEDGYDERHCFTRRKRSIFDERLLRMLTGRR